MNFAEHYRAIEAEKLGKTPVGARKQIVPIPRAYAVNALAAHDILKLARESDVKVELGVLKTRPFNEALDTLPVCVMDISGSMITPENKALVALVAQGLMDAGLDEPHLMGVHTQAKDFEHDVDAFFGNQETGGTILSASLRGLREKGTLCGTNGILYLLTDGDNWRDDNQRFADLLAAMYDAGQINQAVIHVSNDRPSNTSVTAFVNAVARVMKGREGLHLLETGNSFGDSQVNAEKALALFQTK